MRKKLVYFVLVLLFFTCFLPFDVKAKDDEQKNLDDYILELIESLDFSEFEKYLKELPNELSGNKNSKSQLLSMLKGESEIDFSSVSNYLLSLFFGGLKAKLPTFISLFALLLICAIVNSIKPKKMGDGVYEIVHFATFSVVVCIVVSVAYALVSSAQNTIEKTSKAVQSIFPIMLTLMTVTGNSSSVAVYNPAMLFITDFVVIIINKLVFPIILSMLAISVISNVCKTIKLNGLLNFSSSGLKWLIGLVATVFSLFLTVKGLNSGVYDGISLRALKYTVNSSVPLVGGILRDGLDLILASGVLVKNALGFLAIFIIFGVIIQPILEIVSVTLALKLVSAVLEPLNDARVVSFINSVSSVINFIIASVIIVALMYVVLIILAICSSQMII